MAWLGYFSLALLLAYERWRLLRDRKEWASYITAVENERDLFRSDLGKEQDRSSGLQEACNALKAEVDTLERKLATSELERDQLDNLCEEKESALNYYKQRVKVACADLRSRIQALEGPIKGLQLIAKEGLL